MIAHFILTALILSILYKENDHSLFGENIKLMSSKAFLISVSLLVVVFLFVLDEKPYLQKNISFQHGDHTLVGMLVVPKTAGPHPCIVLVHGDGPKSRDGGGAYDVFFDEFASAGWCVLSWDKPGVGQSSGDWLDQSMSERANEVLAAIEFLQTRTDIIKGKIGLFGYSQAGWVLPLAASRSKKVAFIIPVSAAIDVVRQSRYYKRNLWMQQGLSQKEVAARLLFFDRLGKQFKPGVSYESYSRWFRDNAPEGSGEPESRRRWVFDSLIGGVNARASLRKTMCPVLAIWGGNDLHVDPVEGYKVYARELERAGNRDVTLKIFPNADHSLIATDRKRLGQDGLTSLWIAIKYIVLGRDAFAKGYFDLLISWLEKRK